MPTPSPKTTASDTYIPAQMIALRVVNETRPGREVHTISAATATARAAADTSHIHAGTVT